MRFIANVKYMLFSFVDSEKCLNHLYILVWRLEIFFLVFFVLYVIAQKCKSFAWHINNMQDIFWFMRNKHLNLPYHNLSVSRKIIIIVYFIIILINIFSK